MSRGRESWSAHRSRAGESPLPYPEDRWGSTLRGSSVPQELGNALQAAGKGEKKHVAGTGRTHALKAQMKSSGRRRSTVLRRMTRRTRAAATRRFNTTGRRIPMPTSWGEGYSAHHGQRNVGRSPRRKNRSRRRARGKWRRSRMTSASSTSSSELEDSDADRSWSSSDPVGRSKEEGAAKRVQRAGGPARQLEKAKRRGGTSPGQATTLVRVS